MAPNDPQPNKAFLVVNTRSPEQVPDAMRRTEDYILRDLPQASGRADILFLGPAPMGEVQLRVRGRSIETLRGIAAEVSSVEGVARVDSAVGRFAEGELIAPADPTLAGFAPERLTVPTWWRRQSWGFSFLWASS